MTGGKVCTIEGCEKPLNCRGYCKAHYERLRRKGTTDRKYIPTHCTAQGCAKPHLARGYCGTHWARWKRYGSPELPVRPEYDTCAAENCGHSPRSRHSQWCETHYYRIRRQGNHEVSLRWAHRSGEKVSYRGLHTRIVTARGKAAEHTCSCGKNAEHWSYDYSDVNEKIDHVGSPYSLDIDRYIPRCISCHRTYDSAFR